LSSAGVALSKRLKARKFLFLEAGGTGQMVREWMGEKNKVSG